MKSNLELLFSEYLTDHHKIDIKEWLSQNNITKYNIRLDIDRPAISFENVEDRNTFMLNYLHN
jgi:hypothetical protein